MSAFWDAMNSGHARRGAGSQAQSRGEFERAQAQNMIAHTYRHEGNYPVALEEFRKVLTMELGHPRHKSEAQILLGHIYKDLRNHVRAREEYGKVSSIPMAYEDHVKDAQTYLGQLKP